MSNNHYERRFKEITGLDFPDYFKEYYSKVAYYLTKHYTSGNEERSKEYAQMAFMQALEKIDTYDSTKSKLYTWITKIAINLVIRDWKNQQRIDISSLDKEIQDTPGFINIIKQEDGEEETLEHSENVKKCEIILDTIKTLPDKYKKVMVMREIQRMTYRDIADNIRKETKTVVKNKTHLLQTPEDFFSLDLENLGKSEVKVHFTNGTNSYDKVIKPYHSYFILREEIDWERSPLDVFSIISEDTECNISYVTTTNLSTIKSQIKKGRSLIKRKVKRKFDMMEK